ncbi:MAG: hypothetical protein H6R13_2430 [Proteobacteria bacterium]|nr:hypothetical protein [Pseudomonadota bacterium]
MKKVAILQSNYIPWKGYFDLIAAVDEFILYDDAQFTKNDWRNRNKIKTPHGLEWLSIPVGANIHRQIREVSPSSHLWQEKHWKSLCNNYSKAPFFWEIAPILKPLYLETVHNNLSQLNRMFIETICAYLGIKTKITNSWDYGFVPGRIERLLHICHQAGATEYISGPAAQSYIDDTLFAKANIELTWFSYNSYPEYPQRGGAFEHGVSIVDLLFNCGQTSAKYMKYTAR